MKAIEHSEKKAQKAESDVLISQLLRLNNLEKKLIMQTDMIHSQKKLIEDQNELIRQLNINIEEYRVELLNKQKKEIEILNSQLNNLKEENDYYKKCIQDLLGQE